MNGENGMFWYTCNDIQVIQRLYKHAGSAKRGPSCAPKFVGCAPQLVTKSEISCWENPDMTSYNQVSCAPNAVSALIRLSLRQADRMLTKTTIQTTSLHWRNDQNNNEVGAKETQPNTTITIMIKRAIKDIGEPPEGSRWTKVPLSYAFPKGNCSCLRFRD